MDFKTTVSLQLIYNKIYKIILLYYIFLIINKELFFKYKFYLNFFYKINKFLLKK